MRSWAVGVWRRLRSAHIFVRLLVYFGMVYGGYAVLLGLALPTVLQFQVPKQLTEMIGRDVTLQEVKINPFVLKIELNNFSIAEQASPDRFVYFDHARAEINFWQSVKSLSLSLEYFELFNPKINLSRFHSDESQHRFSFSDIPETLSNNKAVSVEDSASSTSEEGIFPLIIKAISINGGQFSFHDQVTGSAFNYHEINVRGLSLHTRATAFVEGGKEKVNTYLMDVSGADGSMLNLSGQFQLQPLQIEGSVELSHLPLAQFWPLTEDLIQAELTQGTLSFSTLLNLREIDEGIQVETIDGKVELQTMKFEHGAEPKLALSGLTVSGIDVNSHTKSISLNSIDVNGLWTEANVDNDGVDLVSYFVPQEQTQGPETEVKEADSVAEDTGWQIIVNKFEANNADFQLNEKITASGSSWRVFPIDMRAEAIHSSLSQPFNYSVALAVSSENRKTNLLEWKESGKLDLNGQMQLIPMNIAGQVKLTDLLLDSLWPLVADIIPSKLTKGTATLGTQFRITQPEEHVIIETTEGSFALKQVRLEHDSEPKVQLKALELEGIGLNTGLQRAELKSAAIKGLWVTAEINRDGLDLPEYFTPKKVGERKLEPSSAQKEKEAPSWMVALSQLTVEGTDIQIKESIASDGTFWRVYPLNLMVGRVQSDLQEPVNYEMDLAVASGKEKVPEEKTGRFFSKGTVHPGEQSISSDVALNDLKIDQFQQYIDPYLNLNLSEGGISIRGKVEADSDGRLQFVGESNVDDLMIKDVLQDDPLVSWQQMDIDSIKFSLQEQILDINKVSFKEPYARVLITSDGRTNIGEIAKTSSDAQSESEDQQADAEVMPDPVEPEVKQDSSTPELSVSIAEVSIESGSAFFADYSLTPNFASGIELIEGYVKSLSSNPDQLAEVDIEGKIDKYAPVSLKGDINPLVSPPYLDLDFSIEHAELTSVSPYSGIYAGYYIDKGQLSLDVNYHLEDNQLEGKNRILVHRLELGNRSESDLATSLPVTLAVSLLKDSNDVIDLEFEVSGDVDSPDFNFAEEIMEVIVGTVTKIITAPFSFLANLVGSDEELHYIEFESGSAKLSASDERRLEKLAEAMVSRPDVTVNVEGAVLAQEDSSAMAEEALHSKLSQNSGIELPEDLSASQVPNIGPLSQALEQLFVEELNISIEAETENVRAHLTENSDSETVDPGMLSKTLHIGMYNQLLSAHTASETELKVLAQFRAGVVKTYLIEQGVKPDKVFIVDEDSGLKTDQKKALLTIDLD